METNASLKKIVAALLFGCLVGLTFRWGIAPFVESMSTSGTYFVKTAWLEKSSDGQTNATVVVQKVIGGKLNPKQMMDVMLGGDLPKPGQLVMFGPDQKLIIVGTMTESVTQSVVSVEPVAAPASDSVVDPPIPTAKPEPFAPTIPSRKTTAKK